MTPMFLIIKQLIKHTFFVDFFGTSIPLFMVSYPATPLQLLAKLGWPGHRLPLFQGQGLQRW